MTVVVQLANNKIQTFHGVTATGAQAQGVQHFTIYAVRVDSSPEFQVLQLVQSVSGAPAGRAQ